MLRGFTKFCVNLASRWLPDSFVLVAILTVFAFLAVLGFTEQTSLRIIQNWGEWRVEVCLHFLCKWH